MRRFTRLTNAFSKKVENLWAAVSLHFAHYNFVRLHKTLRVTPAMAYLEHRRPYRADIGVSRIARKTSMNIPDLSDELLRALHRLIHEALSDDASPDGAKSYGVREYPDWKRDADAFEAEMTKRGIPFDPIDW